MQVKKLHRNDRFNMKRKSCTFYIPILYGCRAMYGFVLILCLFLDSTTLKIEGGDKFFRKKCQNSYFTYFITSIINNHHVQWFAYKPKATYNHG